MPGTWLDCRSVLVVPRSWRDTGQTGWRIPRGSRHVEQAFAWLDYMSGVGVQAWFRNFPDLPANLKVPRDLLPTALVDGKGKAFAQDIMNFFRDSARQRYTDVGFAGARLRHGSDQTSARADHAQGGNAQERPWRGAESLPGRARQGAASGLIDKEHGMAATRAQQARWGGTRRRAARAGLLFVLPWLLSLLLFTPILCSRRCTCPLPTTTSSSPPGGLACRTTARCSPPTRRSGRRSGTVRITPCSPCPSVWPARWAWRCSCIRARRVWASTARSSSYPCSSPLLPAPSSLSRCSTPITGSSTPCSSRLDCPRWAG